MKRSSLRYFLPAILVAGFPQLVHAGPPIEDGAVPAIMDDGVSGIPAEYVLGGTSGFVHDLRNEEDWVYVGFENPENKLTIKNGAELLSLAGIVGMNDTSVGNEVSITGAGSAWDSMFIVVGTFGSSNELRIEAGGQVISEEAVIGFGDFFAEDPDLGSNNRVVVNGEGSTWTNWSALTVGALGSGNSLVIEAGGTVATDDIVTIGEGYSDGDLFGRNNQVTVRGEGSTLTNSTELYIGNQGSGNTFRVEEGGAVEHETTILGSQSGSDGNEAIVSGEGSTWTSPTMMVGLGGAGNTLLIEDGGTVVSGGALVGGEDTANDNLVKVTGMGSSWTVSNELIVGFNGSNNSLIIEEGALVSVEQTINIAMFNGNPTDGEDNYLRLYGGFLALLDNQVGKVEDLITEGVVQIWGSTGWETSTDVNDYQFGFFELDQDAKDFSGYDGLGGYTILTAIPEPASCLLLALSSSFLLLRRRES